MKARCKPAHKSFRWYGAKGVNVCERWQQFERFLEDMGKRPEGMSLDRINGDGDYEPSNCRWATPPEQTGNRNIKNRTSEHKGVSFDKNVKRWVAVMYENGRQFRLGRFKTESEAVFAMAVGSVWK